jgi:hypothetical protein
MGSVTSLVPEQRRPRKGSGESRKNELFITKLLAAIGTDLEDLRRCRRRETSGTNRPSSRTKGRLWTLRLSHILPVSKEDLRNRLPGGWGSACFNGFRAPDTQCTTCLWMVASAVVIGTRRSRCRISHVCCPVASNEVVPFEFAAELLTFIFKWNNLAPFPSKSMISS